MKVIAPPSRSSPLVAALGALLVLALVLALGGEAQARKRMLKIGTAAPRGTLWAKAVEELGARFAELSDGELGFRVYPGVAGDEPTILRKMRVGQLQGAAFTSTGLSLISREPMALQQPLFFDSYAELDAVRDALAPELREIFARHGFVLLTWSDAGWLYFFTKRPAASLAQIQGIKIWKWANDPHAVKMAAELGFVPVVLSSVDLLPSLRTGMIDAFPSTPMAALATQAYSQAPNLIDLPWAPVIGAIIVTEESWAPIAPELKPQLVAAAEQIGRRLRDDVRIQTDEALASMAKNGLRRHAPSPAELEAWKKKVAALNAAARGTALDAALLDRVTALRDAYRARKVE